MSCVGPSAAMVDSPGAMNKVSTLPEIKPLNQYDFSRAKICASVRWLLSKWFGSAENVPVEMREPFYRDQYDQEHLKPSISKLLVSPEIYCRAHALLLLQVHGDSAPPSQGSPGDAQALLQLLEKQGLGPKVQDADVTLEDLSCAPIRMKAHLAMMDALMTLAARQTVGRVKMAAEAEQMGAGAPWENALLFWVNRLNQKLRELTEEEEEEPTNRPPTCSDVQPAQDGQCPSTRWYWKLVPHAIAFCLKESGNKPPVIRYRKDKVQSKFTPTFPLVYGVKDLSNGCAIASVLHYYCPGLLPLEDVCLKDTMSVADSVYNLQLVREFCQRSLQSCCPLAVEDLLYAPPPLHLNIMSFVSELLQWFEMRKPDFVAPLSAVDLTDVSGLLDCTSPINGSGNSASPSFILKQPFVPITSPVPPENQSWTKKPISRPLSAVTFSIPFGLDSDVDVVMGNPIGSVFRSASTDPGIPATTASVSSGAFSPPEDISHLLGSSVPPQRSSWGPYAHTAPLGELPTIEEALQAAHAPGGHGRRKGKAAGKRGMPEARLRPEGAPAGFFLHSPEEDPPRLSSSAPCRSGILHRPAGGEGVVGKGKGERGERGERRERREGSGRTADARDDDSVLRDGSVDSSEASDDGPRNAPGNIRPGKGHRGNHSAGSSPRMTSFAERRDSRRRHPAASGEDAASAPTPATPGTPHTPSTPAGAPGLQDSPGARGPEPGSEAWELGLRLEEKRRSIEAQKRRIEAIFAKHRQRLGKNAFLQLKRHRGGGADEDDSLTLEERLTRMEEQLSQEEEKNKQEAGGEEEQDKPAASNPPPVEKQVTFTTESQKEAENGSASGKEKGGEAVLVEYNEVVQKLSEALQSLQKDMQKLTQQQQQLMSNQRPPNPPKHTPRVSAKRPPQTPPHTPTRTPPRTPTKTPPRSASKARMIPPGSGPNSASPKTAVSSSCPAPRTKMAPAAPRSPKHHPRPQHQPHPRPSELKFPPLHRMLTPSHNVDTLPHLRRVSPSKCQVQTSSSFRIGGPQTPKEPVQPPQADECASETGSSGTPTQFSMELEQDEAAGGPPVLPHAGQDGPRAAGGSSSGAPSECSLESEAFSVSAAYGRGGEAGREASPGKRLTDVSLSSLGRPEEASDEQTDEGQEFSSDSMSEQTEPAGGPALDPTEQLDLAMEAIDAPERPAGPEEEPGAQTGPSAERSSSATKGGVHFFFSEEVRDEEGMAQRKALLLEKQQRRAEELRRRKQWQEQERENRLASSERRADSPSSTPPAGTASPSPTPPATPARRDDFTRAEYARRQQLRIMDDLDRALQQKSAGPVRTPAKKARSRPGSVTREGTQLSLSPARTTATTATGSKLAKVHSHSSANLVAADQPSKKTSSRPNSPACVTPSKLANPSADKDWETGSNGTSPAPEYTGPKLFKEPSFKSNKFIIHNALSRCCLAGKVNETQKNKMLEEMEKSDANHFLILFRDSSCQFRGVYTLNADSQDLVRLAGVGPRTIGSTQVESMFKYSSDRKQFSSIPSKTLGMSVDAFTIPSHLWQGGGAGGGGGGGGAGGAGGGSRRASINKKAEVSK